MDRKFLRYYNDELTYFRELSSEFARHYPKIAGRLALDPDGEKACSDPFVERLIEGFAFLTARVHQKFDSEFPTWTQSLLSSIYPEYLAPTPSMGIVSIQPDLTDGDLAQGFTLPRHMPLRTLRVKGEKTQCIYRTSRDLKLWPLIISNAHYYERDISLLNLPGNGPGYPYQSAIRISFEITANLTCEELSGLNELDIQLRGSDEQANRLMEFILTHCKGIAIKTEADNSIAGGYVGNHAIRHLGFDDEHALFPVSPNTFEGYRLLREYFAFPEQYLFIRLENIGKLLKNCAGNKFELVFLFGKVEPYFEGVLSANHFNLHSVPVINLFSKRLDRINVEPHMEEFNAIPDRTRKHDYEIFQISGVRGIGRRSDDDVYFSPLFRQRDTSRDGFAYYVCRTEPRNLTESEQLYGKQSNYLGSNCFVQLVDNVGSLYRGTIRQLEINAMCTNRHLPLSLALGVGASDFELEEGPIKSIRFVGSPTPPRECIAGGEMLWRMISHLKVNYLSIIGGDEGLHGSSSSVVALRELLALYAEIGNRDFIKQLDSIREVSAEPVVRRILTEGPAAFARGTRINITIDENIFGDSGIFTFASVIAEFLRSYAAINTFVETWFYTEQRGLIKTWGSQIGSKPLL